MTIGDVSLKYDISQDTLRYYEKIGMIPPVTRNASGIRDYSDEDIRWVQLAKCMRASGLSIEAMVKYVQMYQEGDETKRARLELLLEQKQTLLERRQKVDEALEWLNRKIVGYEKAMVDGKFPWETDENG